MNKIEGYKTSKDYELLCELMKKASIICIVNYPKNNGMKESAIASYGGSPLGYRILARGNTYIGEGSKQAFTKACLKYNVEFIEPTEVTHA
jgi:hypothetical protein